MIEHPITANAASNRVREILEWPLLEHELISRCATAPGRSYAASLAPCAAPEARAQMRVISCVAECIRQGTPPDFTGVTDILPLLATADREGILAIHELVAVRDVAVASTRIATFLRQHEERFSVFAVERSRFAEVRAIENTLQSSIDEKGELSDSAYPSLRRMREALFNTRREIENRLRDIIHTPATAQALQEKTYTTRNDRYVLLVKAGMHERVKGTLHDVSASGATYFVEPDEITPLNNRIIAIERELRFETLRILKELSREVARHAAPLRQNCLAIGRVDFLTAAARLSIDMRGSEPEVVDEPIVDLKDARHPLLSLKAGDTVVPSDIRIDSVHPCLIVSGANTGGKTVLLKTVGLCALLAAFGMHLPAGPDSRIGIFERILADIGDDQSLEQSLSSFSGQIEVINEMLALAGSRTLILIDEIVVGTAPRQGAALAQAILERLVETGSRIIVTTHYNELKDLPQADARFMNASVSFDPERLTPTYRLMTGLPGLSYALEIARRCGLPPEITERARALLDERELTAEALIEKIHGHEREIAAERDRLSRMARELEEEKKRYESLMAELERRAGEIRREEGIAFLEELKKYRQTVAARIAELQRLGIKEAARTRDELANLEESVRSVIKADLPALLAGRYEPLGERDPKPGMQIYIAPLEKEGVVVSANSSRRQAVIRVGAIKCTYSYDDLYLPFQAAAHEPMTKKRIITHHDIASDKKEAAVVQTRYNTIDIRGKRVDDGLRMMEDELDRMSRSGIDTVIVIHGHGTGALKAAVRDALTHSPYVIRFRPGEYGEGGDGVTVVYIWS